MTDSVNDPVGQRLREEVERARRGQLPAPPSPVNSVASLPEVEPGSLVVAEWALLRSALGRLLSEGSEGKFALVKSGHPITVWDTLHDAVQAGRLLYPQMPSLVQQVLPDLRGLRIGHNRLCRS
jgi:hypothetical protein